MGSVGDTPQPEQSEADKLIQDEQERQEKETGAPLPGLGHNSDDDAQDIGGIGGKRLLSFIERIERLEEEKANTVEDIKEVKAEAKGVGYCTKTINKIIKLKKMDSEKRHEEDATLDLYMSAIGMK